MLLFEAESGKRLYVFCYTMNERSDGVSLKFGAACAWSETVKCDNNIK